MIELGMHQVCFDDLPKKINLGCGFDHREGYLNIDFLENHKPDLLANVLQLDALPGNFYDEIVAQDILEHLPRTSTKKALVHWNRLLRNSGKLILRVPNVLGIAELLRAPENQVLFRQEELIRDLFGTQAYSGDFHLTSFTEITLRNYLCLSGFEVKSFSAGRIWLFDVEAVKIRDVHPFEIDDFSSMLDGEITEREFIEQCYENILKRKPDSEGCQFYLERLQKNEMSREDLIADFITAEEREKPNLPVNSKSYRFRQIIRRFLFRASP